MSLEWILLGLRLLTTLILYTFLGLAFYLIWQDLKRVTGQKIRMRSDPAYHLRVMASAGEPSIVVGDMLPLQPVTVLGCAPDSTIVLGDASIAARHACLFQENGVWWLEDLGSERGTLLNDLLLSKPTTLAQGDLIGIGNVCFRFEAASAQA